MKVATQVHLNENHDYYVSARFMEHETTLLTIKQEYPGPEVEFFLSANALKQLIEELQTIMNYYVLLKNSRAKGEVKNDSSDQIVA